MKYGERTYRSMINKGNLISYNVKIAESDLLVSSDTNLSYEALKSLTKHRYSLETYIKSYPDFLTSLLPLPEDDLAPPIVRDMLVKSKMCGVGPMAGVAGAVSEFVGYDLRNQTGNLIIENGGDIFIKSENKLIASVYAGESPLSYNVNFIVKPEENTARYSHIVRHSRAVLELRESRCGMRDFQIRDIATPQPQPSAKAKVKSKNDINPAIDFGIKIKGVTGIIIIIGNEMGAIGQVQFV